MTDVDFEQCSLWPIRIHLRHGDGYTFWGSGGGETDLLLAVNQRLRAFTRWPSLVDFIHQASACNLSGLSGYGLLRTLMDQPGNRVPESPREYPFVAVSKWLKVAPPSWTAGMRSTTLDCLNLLWDAARTIGDESSQSRLRRESAPLGPLMDALTFAEVDSFRAAMSEALTSGAADDYARVLTSISDHWDLVP